MTAPASLNGSQSVDRALGLLSLVSYFGDQGGSLSEIVEQGGLNKPTTRRPFGLLEWPALLRKLDRIDSSYKS